MSGCLLYECFSGLAGDMHLGALIDLGVPAEYLSEGLSRLGLDEQFRLSVTRAKKCGISGTLVQVDCIDSTQPRHRQLPQIREIIDKADLPAEAAGLAKSMFRALAEAEAKVHGISVDQVHFHEVGATDAIVDLVGAALGITYLAPESVCCGPVELGAGTVSCEHGLMPVPAPATAELLKHIPTSRGGVDGEATTPTGAAILSTVVHSWEPIPDFRAHQIGYGIGHRDFRLPNVVRLTMGATEHNVELEPCCEIEANLDDMSPEAFEPLLEELMSAGAKDVFFTPVIMKKSRPGVRVSVLVKREDRERVACQLFASSTTLGVRTHNVSKLGLPRQERRVSTSLGEVRVKSAKLPQGTTRWKSEHDDVRNLAQAHRMTYLQAKTIIDSELADKAP